MENSCKHRIRPPAALPVGAERLRVGILSEIPAVLAMLGFDPARVLGEIGLQPGMLLNPDHSVSYQDMSALVHHCVTRTGCAHFGLLLGQRGGAATLGAVGQLIRNVPDVGTALHGLIEYFHHHDQGAVATLGVVDDFAHLGYAIYTHDVLASDHICAGSMAIGYQIMRELCGERWRPAEVLLPFRPPPDVGPFRDFFRAPLRFDADVAALVFRRDWLTFSLQGADTELRRKTRAMLETSDRRDFVETIRCALRRMLAEGETSQEVLACALGMNRRTLVRKLEAQGTTFLAILRDVRLTAACQLLRDTDNAVADIAISLGYGSHGAFARAFKEWTGMTPADWRRRNTLAVAGCNAGSPMLGA